MSPRIPFIAMDSSLPVHVDNDADKGVSCDADKGVSCDAEKGTSSLPVRLLPMQCFLSVVGLLLVCF